MALTIIYRPAKGVLVRFGNFWYPGRMLQREQNTPFSQWRVRMWRASTYADTDETPQGSDVIVPEDRIVDELWHDRPTRRQIRVSDSTIPSVFMDH